MGVVLSSDEKEETITKGLQILQCEILTEILPSDSFYKKTHLSLIMTDDNSTEKAAL